MSAEIILKGSNIPTDRVLINALLELRNDLKQYDVEIYEEMRKSQERFDCVIRFLKIEPFIIAIAASVAVEAIKLIISKLIELKKETKAQPIHIIINNVTYVFPEDKAKLEESMKTLPAPQQETKKGEG